MKHAGPASLDVLEPLLADIRRRAGIDPKIVEKKRGSFYRKGNAWLHFHEDPAGYFADLKGPDDWLRMRVSDPDERQALMAAIDEVLEAA
jgi:hypothetical protein